MSGKKSLKVNFIMNTILTMSAFIFPLISFPYVSRILLPEGTGKVSFATSLISYFVMFAQLGIPTYGVRACAKVRDDKRLLSKTAHELLTINLIMTAISYAALAVALIFVPRLREDRLLYIVVSATVFFTSIGMEWLYKALEQYTYITVRSLIFKLIALGGMFLLVRTKEDYILYGGITIFAASASGVLNFIHARRHIDMRPVGGFEFKPHLKAVAVFFAMSCATTIYTNLDTVMLGFMASDETVGYYSAAVRIKNILVSIVTSLGTVLLPRAAYYVEHKKMDEFHTISRKALNFVLVAAVPMMLYFMLFARDGIFLLSGDRYAGAIHPMRLAMPTLVFIGLSNILGIQIMVPMGKELWVLGSICVGAVVDVVANLLLIPPFGAAGAAMANMLAEGAVTLVQFVLLWSQVKGSLAKIQYWKLVPALGAAVGASVWVAGLGLGSFVSLALSGVLFFAAYGLTLLLLRERLVMEVFGQMLRKVKGGRQ